MDLRTALSVAIPAVALLVVVASPGKARWLRRPWFIRSEPSRFAAALFFSMILGIAVLHAIT
jgi:hypothetical protein